MRRLVPLLALTLLLAILIQSMQQLIVYAAPLLVGGSGHVEFLGQGGTHTVDPGVNFIVKRRNPLRFETVPGPTYTAQADERVWSSTGGAPPAYFKDWVDYGQVPEDCKIKIMTIDDDPDSRINKFYIDDEFAYDMPQGMVSGGEFTTMRSGNLRLWTDDSVGVWLSKCAEEPPPTPTSEPPDTPVPTATATSAPPTAPTATVTGTPPAVTATTTSTPPVSTPTATSPPPDETNTPTPTATKKPRLLSCMRINFELSGHHAKEGLYEVRELGGRLLYVWHAQKGWTDSGWIHNIDISFEDVFVEVFYLDPLSGEPIKLEIYNPAPDTPYGWMSRGMCHAIEVGWPDYIPYWPEQPFEAGENMEGQEETENEVIWPGQEPSPTPTRASSLRG